MAQKTIKRTGRTVGSYDQRIAAQDLYNACQGAALFLGGSTAYPVEVVRAKLADAMREAQRVGIVTEVPLENP
jgi:hypothetical protein